MAAEQVKVVCGANSQEYDNLEGKTIGEVREALAEVLNIPPDAQAIIGGNRVNEDYQIQPGDSLEFVQKAGTKG